MPSTIVLAYAYRSDYLARCLALDTSRRIRLLARSLARSSINTLALPVFYMKRLRRAVSRARSVQCVPAIIGRREILVIEDANTCTCVAAAKELSARGRIGDFLFSRDRERSVEITILSATSRVSLHFCSELKLLKRIIPAIEIG